MSIDIEVESLVIREVKEDAPSLPYKISETNPMIPVHADDKNALFFYQNKLLSYLSLDGNKKKLLSRALQLNNGKYVNACVYFIAETLRQNGVDIPTTTCNTIGLIEQLNIKGWT